MNSYGVRDVERLLRLSRATIRALIEAGFVSPVRGPRNSYRFSFQDLIVLRTAQALVDARVPQRRITRSVRELRRHLPDSMPLSGLSICAVGERVVVREGGSRWQAESGQYLLAFEGNPDGSLGVVESRPAAVPATATQDWFEVGVSLEAQDAYAALRAYRQAIAAEPERIDAHINLGRLLHESGRLVEAERAYRAAIKSCGKDPVLLYNLGALLDDLRRRPEAIEAYEAALRANPALADGHYNLALLYEEVGKPREAIQHMARYRKLVGGN